MGTINPANIHLPPTPTQPALRRSSRPHHPPTLSFPTTNPSSPLLDSDGDPIPEIKEYYDSSDLDDSGDEWKPPVLADEQGGGVFEGRRWGGEGTPIKSGFDVGEVRGEGRARAPSGYPFDDDFDSDSDTPTSAKIANAPAHSTSKKTNSKPKPKPKVNRFISDHPQMARSAPDHFKNTLPLHFTLADPPIPDPTFPSQTPSGLMGKNEFNQIFFEFIRSLSEQKRFKATVNRELARIVVRSLMDPKDTDIGRPQFRFWVRQMFKLRLEEEEEEGKGEVGEVEGFKPEVDVEMQGYYLEHEGRRVVMQEEMWKVLTGCHEACNHGGRDRTMAEVRKRWAYLPKELVARYVAACTTCQGKKPSNLPSLSTPEVRAKAKATAKANAEARAAAAEAKKQKKKEKEEAGLSPVVRDGVFVYSPLMDMSASMPMPMAWPMDAARSAQTSPLPHGNEYVPIRNNAYAPAYSLRKVSAEFQGARYPGSTRTSGGQQMSRSKTEGGLPMSPMTPRNHRTTRSQSKFPSGSVSVPGTPIGTGRNGIPDLLSSPLSPIPAGYPSPSQYLSKTPGRAMRRAGADRMVPLQVQVPFGYEMPQGGEGLGYGQEVASGSGSGSGSQSQMQEASGTGGYGYGTQQNYPGDDPFAFPAPGTAGDCHQPQHQYQQGGFTPTTPSSQVISYGTLPSGQSTPLASALIPMVTDFSRRGSTQTDLTFASGGLYTPHTQEQGQADFMQMGGGTGEGYAMNMAIFGSGMEDQPNYGMNLFGDAAASGYGHGYGAPTEQSQEPQEGRAGLGLDIGQANQYIDPALQAEFQADFARSNSSGPVHGMNHQADANAMFSPDMHLGARPLTHNGDLRTLQEQVQQVMDDFGEGRSFQAGNAGIPPHSAVPSTPTKHGDSFAGMWPSSPTTPTPTSPRPRTQQRKAARQAQRVCPYTSPINRRELPRFPDDINASPTRQNRPIYGDLMSRASFQPFAYGEEGNTSQFGGLSSHQLPDDNSQAPQAQMFGDQGYHSHKSMSGNTWQSNMDAISEAAYPESAPDTIARGSPMEVLANDMRQDQIDTTRIPAFLDNAGTSHEHDFDGYIMEPVDSGANCEASQESAQIACSSVSRPTSDLPVPCHSVMRMASAIASGNTDKKARDGELALQALPCTPNPSNEIKEVE